MDCKHILFDLDGTLIDNSTGITNSVTYALNKVGILENDRRKLLKFVGPPLPDSFQKYYGFSREDSIKLVVYFQEYYREKGIHECELYDGMRTLLPLLKMEGKTLLVATSKPEVFAREILRSFEVDGCFAYIAGSNMDVSRAEKDLVIAYALESAGISDLSKAVMVGDREHDIIAAKKVGIRCIGVLYGFGSKEELEEAGADHIASSVEELGAILRSS